MVNSGDRQQFQSVKYTNDRHTHARKVLCTERPCRSNLPLNFCRALSLQSLQLSIQLSVLARKASFNSEFAALSLVRGGTCDICTDMLEIILHVIVAQIGGQRRCRQGNVARDTEEMFNHGPAHSGASLFSLSSLWFISLSCSRSLFLCPQLPGFHWEEAVLWLG